MGQALSRLPGGGRGGVLAPEAARTLGASRGRADAWGASTRAWHGLALGPAQGLPCRVRHRCQDPLPESSAGCADISTPWSPNVLAPRRRPTGPQTCRDPEDRQAGQRVTTGVEWADCKGSSGCVTVSERATPHRTYRERCGSDAAIPGVGRPHGQRHVASCG